VDLADEGREPGRGPLELALVRAPRVGEGVRRRRVDRVEEDAVAGEPPPLVSGQHLAQPGLAVGTVELHPIDDVEPGGIARVHEQPAEDPVAIGPPVADVRVAVVHVVVVEVVRREPRAAGRRGAPRVDPVQRSSVGVGPAARIDARSGAVAAEPRIGEELVVFDAGGAQILTDGDVAEHLDVVGRVIRVGAALDPGDQPARHVVGARRVQNHQLMAPRRRHALVRPGTVVHQVAVDGAGRLVQIRARSSSYGAVPAPSGPAEQDRHHHTPPAPPKDPRQPHP
jgi:hypothetical protein